MPCTYVVSAGQILRKSRHHRSLTLNIPDFKHEVNAYHNTMIHVNDDFIWMLSFVPHNVGEKGVYVTCDLFSFLLVQLIIAVAGVLTGYNGSFEFKEPGQEYGEYPYVGMRVVGCLLFSYILLVILDAYFRNVCDSPFPAFLLFARCVQSWVWWWFHYRI